MSRRRHREPNYANWGTWRARFHRHHWGYKGFHDAMYGWSHYLGNVHTRRSHYRVCEICGLVRHDRIEGYR
ncbi:hypothetical protein [Tomitella cavernea]|uniref:Uncharacterized protein n=1 Tax=Tomitella cavernea TaxID=1387982 RepID=A0ABP9CHS4_9ACTN|nr:hypothetical protein [Tomitella cavernea]